MASTTLQTRYHTFPSRLKHLPVWHLLGQQTHKTSPGSLLPDGTEGCGRGGGMALNLRRFPKNSLTCCHATADLSNKHPGKGEKQGRVPSPSLFCHNLERPDSEFVAAFLSKSSRLVSELVLLRPDCKIWFFVCPSLRLIMSGSRGESGTKCKIMWCFF